jgi:hypothetical protein
MSVQCFVIARRGMWKHNNKKEQYYVEQIQMVSNGDIDVLLLGDTCVGKTSLIHSLIGKPVPAESTIGVQYFLVHLPQYAGRLRVWDVSGDARFSFITESLYNRVRVGLVMYSVYNRASFESAARHTRRLRRERLPVWLLGTDASTTLVPRTVAGIDAVGMEVDVSGETQLRDPNQTLEFLYRAIRLLGEPTRVAPVVPVPLAQTPGCVEWMCGVLSLRPPRMSRDYIAYRQHKCVPP